MNAHPLAASLRQSAFAGSLVSRAVSSFRIAKRRQARAARDPGTNFGHVALACLLAAASPACGGDVAEPRPQWTVVISTNGQVPQFGNRLLVEIYDDTGAIACAGCRRQFGVGEESTWPWSFGVVPNPSGSPPTIRVRLYRTSQTDAQGLPAGTLLIDSVAKLPPVDSAERVSLPLDMGCFGVPANLEQQLSCDPSTGVLGPAPTLAIDGPTLTMGSWPLLVSKPCEGSVPDDMVCVPSGAFLLGHPIDIFPGTGVLSATAERLVAVSPFALDRYEVTVGQFRTLIQAGQLSHLPETRSADAKSVNALCTYVGAEDASADALPANCVSHVAARLFCEAVGKRLPTEAEWEYAAGNRNLETKFPWGNDGRDLCNMAVVERGRPPLDIGLEAVEEYWCRAMVGVEVMPPGPVAGGHENDVTLLGVQNLAGNVQEWVADGFAPYDDPCWGAGSVVATDPLCLPDFTETNPYMAIRGAGYAKLRISAAVFTRSAAQNVFTRPHIGFRCALDM